MNSQFYSGRENKPRSGCTAVRGLLRLAVIFSISVSISGAVAFSQTQAQESQEKAAKSGDKPADPTANQAANQTANQKQPVDLKTQHQTQLEEDTARLLVLANELKAEMDKSTKDTLSLGVIKKAEEIEKLAKKVRGEMKESQGK